MLNTSRRLLVSGLSLTVFISSLGGCSSDSDSDDESSSGGTHSSGGSTSAGGSSSGGSSGAPGGATSAGGSGAAAGSAAGGSSGEGGSGGTMITGCLPTPAGDVSFETDLVPVLRKGCADADCHGDKGDPDGNLWLGPPNGEPAPSAATLDEIHGNLTGLARIAINARRVEAGDLETSWLWAKLNDTQGDGSWTCFQNDCGDPMPNFPAPDICADERATIRAWIEQGAPR